MCIIADPESGMLDLFCVLCKFSRSQEHGVGVVFTAIGLDLRLLWTQGTLDIGHNGFREHRVICQQIPGPTAHTHDSLDCLADT